MKLAVLALLVLSACTPSPESLCEHTMRVVERQFASKEDHKAHVAGVKQCKAEWEAKRKADPKAYECYAKCATSVKTMVDLASCRTKCYPGEIKPPDETQNLEGIIWSDDASATPPPASAPSASANPPSPSASAKSPPASASAQQP